MQEHGFLTQEQSQPACQQEFLKIVLETNRYHRKFTALWILNLWPEMLSHNTAPLCFKWQSEEKFTHTLSTLTAWTIVLWALLSCTNTKSATMLQRDKFCWINYLFKQVMQQNKSLYPLCHQKSSKLILLVCRCWKQISSQPLLHHSTTQSRVCTVGFNQQQQNLFDCHWQLSTIQRHNWLWHHFRRRRNGNRRSMPLDDNFINSSISKLDKKHSKKTLQWTDI